MWSHSHRYFTDHPDRDPQEHFIQDALGNARSVYRRVKDHLIAPMPSWRYHLYQAGTGRLTTVQLADSNGFNPTEFVTFTYDSAGNTTRLFRSVQTPGVPEVEYLEERAFTYYGADQRPRVGHALGALFRAAHQLLLRLNHGIAFPGVLLVATLLGAIPYVAADWFHQSWARRS